jgi:hypothetical protein
VVKRSGLKNFAFWVLGTCVCFAACGSDDNSQAARSEGGEAGESGAGNPGGSGSLAGASASGGTAVTSGPGGAGAGGADAGGSAGELNGGSGGDAGGSGGASGADGGANSLAGGGAGGAATCEVGEAQSPAAPGSLDLFGQIAYFGAGDELPAGHYRVSYVDGCMKYASDQAWAIHAYENGTIGWWLGTSSGDKLVLLPGTVGISAFTSFESCVAANAVLASIDFEFAGGKLGVWLADNNYGDNVAGVDGRNPIWKLTLLDGACQ